MSDKKYYISTAIAYTSGKPHIGNVYEIVLADGNFPSESVGKNAVVVRADGLPLPELLDAILTLLPLDSYVEKPAALMAVVPGDPCKPDIWDEYKEILEKHGENPQNIEMTERFAFYERARNAYAVVATGEERIYANILLKKGVVK